MKSRRTTFEPELKLYDEGSGSFSGYASTFGNLDRANEIVCKGAFAKTLEEFKASGFVAVGHDWGALPVATIKDAREDDRGLFIVAEFHSTPEAQQARTVVKERLERGKSCGLSIGYTVDRDERGEKGERLLKELTLFEASLVTVPCNPQANATGVKGEHFGDHTAASASISAICSLMEALLYGPVMMALYDQDGTTEERMAQFDDAVDEWAGIVRRYVAAALSGEGEETAEEAREAIKSLYPVETKHSGTLASGGPVDAAEGAAAALKAAIDALRAHAAARAQQSRPLSEADRERVKTLSPLTREFLAALQTLEAPPVGVKAQAPPEAVRQALIQSALTQARLNGVPVLH